MNIRRVIVYVEGASDKLAMQALLKPLLDRSRQAGVGIEFFEYPKGDRKVAVVTKAPLRAVNILQNDPGTVVVVMPDLYPRNKGFRHETVAELTAGVQRNFDAGLQKKGLAHNRQIRERFKVFCFKHDLEALILAAEEALQRRLGSQSLGVKWRRPVEDQNQGTPPKLIVEEIYRKHGKRYKETVDAQLVLSGAAYHDIAERCPQCFKPFVEFLEGLIG